MLLFVTIKVYKTTVNILYFSENKVAGPDLLVHNGAFSTMAQNLFWIESYVAHFHHSRVILWQTDVRDHFRQDQQAWC